LKFSIGRAKNEALELLLGDSLIAFAGVGVGIIIPELSKLYYLLPFCMGGFVTGFIFDIRALRKFKHDMSELKEQTDLARRKLEGVMNELDQHRHEIGNAKNELNRSISELQKHKKELEEHKRSLEGIQRKTFSFISQVSSGKPLESTIQELNHKIANIERTIRNLQGRLR